MYSSEQEEYQEPVEGSSGGFYQNNKVLVWVFIAVILIAIGILIFKKGGSDTQNTIADYSIKIYPENDIIISPGNNYKLLAVVNNNSSAVITWTSSDEAIAKVDNGTVTAISYGKVVITASYTQTDGKIYEAKKDISIAEGKKEIPITDVSVKTGDLMLPIGGTYSIIPEITPTDGYVFSKKFISSNPSVVTVTDSGLVQAISEGDAVITVDFNSGAYVRDIKTYVRGSITISEIVVNPTAITLSKEINSIKVGGTAKVSYTVTPNEASDTILDWSSSDTSVLTVDKNGIITALKEGAAVIKITSVNGISDTLEVTVEPNVVLVTDIQIALNELALEVGQNQVVAPVMVPDNATDKTITCTSSNPASVNAILDGNNISCVVTALAEGNSIVTIKSNSSNITKTINVTVSAPASQESTGGGSCASCSKVTCAAGKYCSCGKCYTCTQGYYCSGNKRTACPAGKSSGPGASSYQDCYACAKGYYLSSGKCVACPSGYTTASSGATSKSACNVKVTPTTPVTSCQIGYFINSSGECQICTLGNYCANGKTRGNCPAGKGKKVGAKSSSECQLCDYGYTSSAGGSCKKCASGQSDSTRTKCI